MDSLPAELRSVVRRAAARLRELSPAAAARPPAPGKWSAKQVIGHLIDSAANNHGRFVRAQLEPEHLDFPGYEQDGWVAAQRYEEEPWERLVELWRLYNLHVAHVMSAASDEDLRRPRARHSLDRIAWRVVPRDQPATLEYMMRDYVGHLEHHLTQIFDPSY